METLLKYNGADILGFAMTLASLHLLGNHRRSGFLVGAAASVAWAWFSFQAESVPTLTANAVFLGMNLRGWSKWRNIPDDIATADSPLDTVDVADVAETAAEVISDIADG